MRQPFERATGACGRNPHVLAQDVLVSHGKDTQKRAPRFVVQGLLRSEVMFSCMSVSASLCFYQLAYTKGSLAFIPRRVWKLEH